MSSDFITAAGARFQLRGQPYAVAGANCYYLGFCSTQAMIDSVLDTADAFSLNVLRICAFHDLEATGDEPPRGMFGACFQYFDRRQNRVVRPNDDAGLRRLDRAVASAGARGFRLILVLTNSLPDFGGMDAYLRWFSPEPALLHHDEFYDREDVGAAYQDWVQHLLERTNTETGRRYKDDPAILAWELANEPRCASPGGLPSRRDCGRRRLLGWIRRMSAFIKSIDPSHMVTVGDEGFFHRGYSCNHLYDGRYGVDTEAILKLPDVDFGTYHLYPLSWGRNDREFGLRWIRQHARIARRTGKPMLLEEYGLPVGTGFVRDPADRDALYAEWMRAAAAEGPGSLFWMLAGVEADGQRFRHPDPYCLFEAREAPRLVAQTRELHGSHST